MWSISTCNSWLCTLKCILIRIQKSTVVWYTALKENITNVCVCTQRSINMHASPLNLMILPPVECFFSALRNSCNTWIYETSFKSQLDRLLILKSSLCFLSSWTVDSSETQGCSWWKLLALTHSRKAFQQANMLRFLPRWQRSLLSDSRQDLQGRDSGWHVCRECFLLLCWTWVASASAITDFQAL